MTPISLQKEIIFLVGGSKSLYKIKGKGVFTVNNSENIKFSSGTDGNISFLAQVDRPTVQVLKALKEAKMTFYAEYDVVDETTIAVRVDVGNPWGEKG